jgi:glycerophosphoryl diester phosphodiesterase
MKHPFFISDRPLVFAHRGGGALSPENTLCAFDNGLAHGADGLEFDVHLSRDGVVMVHHDHTIDRTTNLHGPIAQRTAAELAQADAGWHFRRDNEYPFRGRGIGVPTLAEVLARHRGVRIIVELKTGSAELAQAVVAAIRAADAVKRVCVGSFDVRGLRIVRALEPAIATSAARVEVVWALMKLWCRRPLTHASYEGYQVPERSGRTPVVSPAFVNAAHRAGLGVQVWTVDRPEDALRLLGYGVDALITDHPDAIVPICRRAGASAARECDRAFGHWCGLTQTDYVRGIFSARQLAPVHSGGLKLVREHIESNSMTNVASHNRWNHFSRR